MIEDIVNITYPFPSRKELNKQIPEGFYQLQTLVRDKGGSTRITRGGFNLMDYCILVSEHQRIWESGMPNSCKIHRGRKADQEYKTESIKERLYFFNQQDEGFQNYIYKRLGIE